MNSPNQMSVITPYFHIGKMAFTKMLAYRMRYYTGIFTYLLYVSINFYIWKGVFSNIKDTTLNGYSFPEISTYIVIGWLLRSFAFSTIDDEIDSLVSTGNITNFLIRPVNFQFYMFSSATGEAVFRIFMFSLPIAITLLFFFPIIPPLNLTYGLYTALAAFLGFFIFAQINFMIGLLSFFLYSIRGLMRAKYFFVQICSGLLMPLSFFPPLIEKLLICLPFQAITFIPLQIYLGKYSSTVLPQLILVQLLWIIILTIAGQILWKKAVSNLVVNGG